MNINLKERLKIVSKPISLGSVIAVSAFSLSLSAATPKHIAVPPTDMASQKLLSPEQKGIFSESTMIPISASQLNIQKKLLMDNSDNNPIVFLSPSANLWQIQITDPSGRQLLNEEKNQLAVKPMTIGEQRFSGKQLSLESPNIGEWQVTLSQKSDNKTPLSDGYLMFKGDPNYRLYSHLDSNLTTQNNNINIVAFMVDGQSNQLERSAINANHAMQSSVTSAYALITSPSKQTRKLPLNDQGINGDKVAGDGLFSSKIPTHETGVYTSQVHVEGIRPDGIRYSRTATDIYPIEKTSFKFSGQPAQIKYANGKTILSVPVSKLTDSENIYLSAEVWGTNLDGKRESAAWVGGVVSPNSHQRETQLELTFDTRWLKHSQLQPPFALKSLRLQTVNNNVPVDVLSKLKLNASERVKQELPFKTQINLNDLSKGNISDALSNTDRLITQDMLMGAAPQQTRSVNKASGTKLLLVHGYCSDAVWNPNHFSDAAVFEDYDQNRTNEEFAQLILSFGSSYSSYGIVAHSQGGAAAVHLYSRYWSGLDYANGGRIIQSVGTPYQGTALAGSIAAIGDIFGIQCGYATDLTYSGASNWLSTIPSWARSEVDYYTTSFTDKWWRWDYCHIASDVLLSDPDDGTTEKWSGQLSGAVNKGHKTGQCHTSGMRDMAQTNDTGRNASMNSRAAR